jgi:alpha-ribazole phosphatase
MDILIVRHTQVNFPYDVLYGNYDVPLADSFPEEANSVKARLANWFPFDKVYSSPLSRALKLAQFLQNGSIIIDDRLKEINFGDWELKKWSEIPDFNEWVKNPVTPPNGETYKDLIQRFKAFFDELLKKNGFETKILITSHSGLIRCALSLFTAAPLEKIFRFTVDYGRALHIKVHDYPEEWINVLPKVILPSISIKGFNI